MAIDNVGETVSVVELIELDYLHRRGEFQNIIAPHAQGRGYATVACATRDQLPHFPF